MSARAGSMNEAVEMLHSDAPFILANDEDYDGNTALQFAVRHSKHSVGNCLLSHLGNPLHPQKGTGLTPVHTACMLVPKDEDKEGRLALLEEMMISCNGRDVCSAQGQTALQLACERGFAEAGHLVLQARQAAYTNLEALSASLGQIEAELASVNDQTDWHSTLADAYQQWQEKLAEQKAAAAAEEAALRKAKETTVQKEIIKKDLLAKGYTKKEVSSALSSADSLDDIGVLIDSIEATRVEEKKKREARAEQRKSEEAARAAAEAKEAKEAGAQAEQWAGQTWDGWKQDANGNWVEDWCEHRGEACWGGCMCPCGCSAGGQDECDHPWDDCPDGWCSCGCRQCSDETKGDVLVVKGPDGPINLTHEELESRRMERVLEVSHSDNTVES